MQLFYILSKLLAYCALSDLADLSHLPDLQSLAYTQQPPLDINGGALKTLLDYVINWSEVKKSIWTATYNFIAFKIVSKAKNTSLPTANCVVVSLYDIWHYFYLIAFLEAL